MSIDPSAPLDAAARRGAVMTALRTAASATGADFDYLVRTARRESNFDPSAKASTSSATGLFQFTSETWLRMVDRYGTQHGLGGEAKVIDVGGEGRASVTEGGSREAILALRNDPDLSARMAGELARENAKILGKKIGRPATSAELYTAHFMGPADASRLIRAARANEPGAASEIFPTAALANSNVFRSRAGEALTAAELYSKLTGTSVEMADAGKIAPAKLSAPRAESVEAQAIFAARMGAAQLASGLMAALFDLQDETRKG